MHCSSCNAEVEVAAGGRIGFADECSGCAADLHTCRNCAFYDSSAYNDCRESSAERVSDRDRANRCEYFRPGDQSGGSGLKASRSALGALDALFKKD